MPLAGSQFTNTRRCNGRTGMSGGVGERRACVANATSHSSRVGVGGGDGQFRDKRRGQTIAHSAAAALVMRTTQCTRARSNREKSPYFGNSGRKRKTAWAITSPSREETGPPDMMSTSEGEKVIKKQT